MKYIFVIAGLISWNTVFSQSPCPTTINVISPVVFKPVDANITATCTAFTLQWHELPGSTDQNYIASIMSRDPLNPTKIDTVSLAVIGGTLTATFPVTAGISVSWSVQAKSIIDGRTFYSYPLRSSEEYTIPDCVNPSFAAEQTPATTSNSLPATEEEKVKVDLYPNPVHNVLNLNISSVVKTAVAKNGSIRVVGIDGKTVLTQKAAFGRVQINVSRLINGAYFIRVEDAGGKLLYIAKFVKE